MSVTNTIKTSVKGIEIELTFGATAIEMIGKEMLRLLEHDPDNFLIHSAYMTAPVVLYWGYYNTCMNNQMPLIFDFDDFLQWTNGHLNIKEGREEMIQIVNFYLTIHNQVYGGF